MLVIIPMAGVGAIDSPITISKPKGLLKVANKYLIDHLLEKLQESLPKNTRIVFIVGYKKKILKDYVSMNYSNYFDLQFIEQKPVGYKGDLPYFSGLGDAIALAATLGATEDCLILLGDMLPIEGYNKILESLNKEGDAFINVQKVENPNRYGVCLVDDTLRIQKIVEKPTEFVSDWGVKGAYLFKKCITSQLFTLLNLQMNDPRLQGKYHDFTSIIQKLIQTGAKISIVPIEQPILDFGYISSILQGNALLLKELQGKTTMEGKEFENKLQNSCIIPPVSIGKGTKIYSSVIGPNVSIGNNISITKCVIEDSLIGDNSILEGLTTVHSVIGEFVAIEGIVKNNLVIGDASTFGNVNESNNAH